MSIMPYISASIIVQLMTTVVPFFEATERKKVNPVGAKLRNIRVTALLV